MKANFATLVQRYFARMAEVRSSGGATDELSYYGALENLLNGVGEALNPKVICNGQLRDAGAGQPDFGLYAAEQCQGAAPEPGQVKLPARGVIEAKPPGEAVRKTAKSAQVRRYLERYGLVLVTNYREFLLIGKDAEGQAEQLENFQLAESEPEFWRRVQKPKKFAAEIGVQLGEYLSRVLSHQSVISDPEDLAALLASYARDALARVGAGGNLSGLTALRGALEAALGVEFQHDRRGAHFFRSTLVQTLFYGVFSSWVLWARGAQQPSRNFDWQSAAWHLRVPILSALFEQVSSPSRLRPLGLVPVLDWAAAALNRVDREAFFRRFSEDEAVQYFYEPFLAAYDPDLRKELGVWFTPPEVVNYMVARVDRALREDLGVADGFANERVYVLDPCCGTGAYLAAVLRRAAETLRQKGAGALAGDALRRAACERLFGFEILPAPFVVAHMQVDLTLRALDAALPDNGARPGVHLTNALTGWEPRTDKPDFAFPELEEERIRAEGVKQNKPILVVLGNPPYNSFAGMAMGEERELSTAYRSVQRVRRPKGQGLNDLYVRFFRMAERRIVEQTGRGVVCFISNYSWLDGMSFTGMRERYLDAFDAIRIDCLNGDKYKTGKRTPEGEPDPSVFSTERSREGIQVGTAISLLVRKGGKRSSAAVGFRHLWGRDKRRRLTETEKQAPGQLYAKAVPSLPLGLPFMPAQVGADYLGWPKLPELLPASFPGVVTSRNGFLVDIDLERLKARIANYFDEKLDDAEIARLHPAVMKDTARFDARRVRRTLLERGGPTPAGFVRHAYRPFDTRWIYWEADTKLLDEKRATYKRQVFDGNLWLEARAKQAAESFSRGAYTKHLADNFGNGLSSFFPVYLRATEGLPACGPSDDSPLPNLSEMAARHLNSLRGGLGVEDLFHHILAILHSPTYRSVNAGALRLDWPRIPLPQRAGVLRRSAALGRELAALLDPETPVPGVTEGKLRPELAPIATPAKRGGGQWSGGDFSVRAGWGHPGQGGIVMPGAGRTEPAPARAPNDPLGREARHIHLNADAYLAGIPAAVWDYKLGGYPVLKKWLSYREHKILGRPLHAAEARHLSDTARRIAAILLLSPQLDDNYERAASDSANS